MWYRFFRIAWYMNNIFLIFYLFTCQQDDKCIFISHKCRNLWSFLYVNCVLLYRSLKKIFLLFIDVCKYFSIIWIYIFKFNCKAVLAKSSNVMGLRIFDILIYFTKNQTDFYTQSFYYRLQILKRNTIIKKIEIFKSRLTFQHRWPITLCCIKMKNFKKQQPPPQKKQKNKTKNQKTKQTKNRNTGDVLNNIKWYLLNCKCISSFMI